MASRRTRIKVLANIPQRRKTDDPQQQEPLEEEATKQDIEIQSESKLEAQVTSPIKPAAAAVSRRKFIKPTICVSAISRKPKPIEETGENVEEKLVTLEETSLGTQGVKVNDDAAPVQTPSTIVENITDRGIRNITPHISILHSNSDTEYPPPPPSPSKINRARIKAVPRLSQRKTSFSASESEDESRRHYNRHRNDSVCSTTSGAPESLSECLSPQRPKEFSSAIQKKCRRTEQSRKLANARTDFLMKFGHKKPDRQKLTMIDLIFYNPTTNPMTNEAKPTSTAVEAPPEPQPLPTEPDPVESDEENEMPVPQIKIGPEGDIILDERSLVVENKRTKKERQTLENSQLIDGDFDTGYGIYKRHKRAKDWTHSETLRFYKAINTIGTDFTLMCELFPRRSRRELKMKFKKEERINKNLVDKAVMQPCNFDFAELKQDVQLEEKELEELERQKEIDLKQRQEREARLSKKRKTPQDKQPEKPKIRKLKRRRPLDINSALDSDADVSSESDVETEPRALKPTRSGRVPKATQKYPIDDLESCPLVITPNTQHDLSTIEPGSLMIMPTEGPNGEKSFNVFMVTPGQGIDPLKLSGEAVAKAIEYKEKINLENIFTVSQNEIVQENNITIPAPSD